MSKEKTIREVRGEFISHIKHLTKYWNEVKNKDCKEKLDGLAFSILAMLDGSSADICGFVVAPCPHEDDKQYNIDNGNDYYPENDSAMINCDIAGSLHDEFYK